MRKSLLLIAAVCGLMSAGCCADIRKSMDKEMAVQLYSVRDLIGKPALYAQNHETVLKAIADMGYTAVEAASYRNGLFYGVSPAEFKADVESVGMKVLASHVARQLSEEELSTGDFSKSLKWWEQTIAAHKEAGMKYLVCPHMAVPKSLADLKTYCDYYNEIGRMCKAEGMSFGYHNHAHEFKKVEEVVMLDYMLENTDPSLVFFQMDVYWAVYGHASPVEYFERYPGRFTVLHIKDAKEIGQSGMVGFDAIFNNAEVAGLKEYVVEVEGCRHDQALEGLRVSADYLKNAPFVRKSYK